MLNLGPAFSINCNSKNKELHVEMELLETSFDSYL